MRYFIYFRDLPDAELRMIDGTGHWLLETHCARALPLVRNFRDCPTSAPPRQNWLN